MTVESRKHTKSTGKCLPRNTLNGRTITHKWRVSTRKSDKVTLCSQPDWMLGPPGVGEDLHSCAEKPRPCLPGEHRAVAGRTSFEASNT